VIAIENIRLFKELQERNRDLTEALEQQTATSEILRAIANSPTEIQPVLDVIAEHAGRICGTPDVSIVRVEDDAYRIAAIYGSAPNWTAGENRPVDRGSVIGRSIVDRETIHLHDVRTVQDDFWRVKTNAVQQGLRTMLATPLLREGVAIGAIGIRRTEVLPFTDKRSRFSKPLPTRPCILLENVRLFKNSRERMNCANSGTSDGNRRGARHHQPLAYGRAAGARRDSRKRCQGLWDRRCGAPPSRR
jgi:transcriptional regulator with GAF, ATPase, and Fis domain